jgi:6-phosphogluconolactonase
MKPLIAGLAMAALVGTMSSSPAQETGGQNPLVFVTSFAAAGNGAIRAYHLDRGTGKLNPTATTKGVPNPFFLALSPDRRFLYSIHAPQFGGSSDEKVAAYEIRNRAGELRLLNEQSSRGTASCYLQVDATGKTVLVANYSSGSVASLPIHKDGSLGEAASFVQHVGSSVNQSRQQAPHAHSIIVSPDNRFAFAADLGLDQVVAYRLDAGKAKLGTPRQPFVRTPPGVGPRHITFHPNGKQLYAINELANSVTAFDYDARSGVLIEKQTISTVPAGFTGTSYCADVKITPDGRFLYGTNRGHDSVAAYRIADDGRLSLIEIEPSLGKGPQNLLITPDGGWLLCANMPGNNVVSFRIDPENGKISPAGTPTQITSPSCIMLVP